MKITGTHDAKMIELITLVHNKAVNLLPEIKDIELTLNLNSRMRSCAGKALVSRATTTGKIQLNYRLHKDNPREIENTYLHELAHVVANIRYNKNCAHGYLWKRVMRELNANDDRCHTMDTSAYKNKTTRLLYKCGCKEHTITKNRHNKILRGAIYKCTKCKQQIKEAA